MNYGERHCLSSTAIKHTYVCLSRHVDVAFCSNCSTRRQTQAGCYLSFPYLTKYLYIKITTVYVPSSDLELPQPLSRKRVCPEPSPPDQRGGGGTVNRLQLKGWGSPNSDDWRKSLALCLLCALSYYVSLCYRWHPA